MFTLKQLNGFNRYETVLFNVDIHLINQVIAKFSLDNILIEKSV